MSDIASDVDVASTPSMHRSTPPTSIASQENLGPELLFRPGAIVKVQVQIPALQAPYLDVVTYVAPSTGMLAYTMQLTCGRLNGCVPTSGQERASRRVHQHEHYTSPNRNNMGGHGSLPYMQLLVGNPRHCESHAPMAMPFSDDWRRTASLWRDTRSPANSISSSTTAPLSPMDVDEESLCSMPTSNAASPPRTVSPALSSRSPAIPPTSSIGQLWFGPYLDVNFSTRSNPVDRSCIRTTRRAHYSRSEGDHPLSSPPEWVETSLIGALHIHEHPAGVQRWMVVPRRMLPRSERDPTQASRAPIYSARVGRTVRDRCWKAVRCGQAHPYRAGCVLHFEADGTPVWVKRKLKKGRVSAQRWTDEPSSGLHNDVHVED
ncbi:hypothetical protein C8Q79DRAFT_941408 [Trametes meyenii]|nr:hypothetical protein C8Q79DRAFT_941408 [Trametes meyenii]